MTNPAVLWPAMLGVLFLGIGIITYREELRLLALGPVFVAAALAAFAGEHFTAAASLAQIVPKFLPGRLFIAYFVGIAHFAAATSFVAKRYVRLSSLSLAAMFALFVLLMDLPSAVTHPGVRMAWSLAAREATFSIGALALFAIVTSGERPHLSERIATFARIWAACVLVFYGMENVLYPQFAPGVPDTTPTASWVPAPHVLAYVTGAILIACGLAMFVKRTAALGAMSTGLLMIALAAGLFVPQFFIEQTVVGRVTAINFIFDTLLFAGTILIVGTATRIRGGGAKAEWSAQRVARSEEVASV